jgi:hypothetical protein
VTDTSQWPRSHESTIYVHVDKMDYVFINIEIDKMGKK